jgi:hypothetical protein
MKGGHIAIITTQGGGNNVMQRIKYLRHIAMWREVVLIMQREATTWKEATIATQRELTLAWREAIVAWKETTTNINIMCEGKQATKKNKMQEDIM